MPRSVALHWFYGYPDVARRKEGWNLLRTLSKGSVRPWVCAGDFNEILEQHEKQGALPRPQWQIKDFRDCLDDCGLQDIGFEGAMFTWCNHREEPNLDRVCSDTKWANLFPRAKVSHVAASCSDHSALLVALDGELTRSPPRTKQRFRFEAVWVFSRACADIIKQTWDSIQAPSYQGLLNKIRTTRLHLKQWDRESFENIRRQSQKLHERICHLKEGAITPSSKAEVESLRNSLERLVVSEELLWKQRAKALWLAEGDRNTGFFHAKANEHRLNKEIKKIRNEDGIEVGDKEGIQRVILHYFRSIFGGIHPTEDDMEMVLGSQLFPLSVTSELNHFLKHKKRGKKGYVSLKVDVSKAYDRVEWSFLEKVFGRLGFNHHFVSLIMSCVSSVSFSFLLNGEQFGFLRSDRGLRQGDPLSPYLFLLCAEAFCGMIRNKERNEIIQGIAVSRSVPRVSHLLFADDTLIFCRATPEAMLCLKRILTLYEQGSGLKINLKKSVMVVSSNVEGDLPRELAGTLGVEVTSKHDKYLGLPTVAGRSKRDLFESIKDRVWRKVNIWVAKKLSQAGHAVLLKTVLQTIPIYTMSCFRFPDLFLNELESLMASFFWNCGHESKIHWKSWAFLCRHKKEGGLGFRRLRECNLALLAKQAWRIAMKTEGVVHSVLSLQWKVGDGCDISIIGHPWILRPETFQPICKPFSLPADAKVSSLITADHEWNTELIRAEFSSTDADCILEIPLRVGGSRNILVWHFEKDDMFSVCSAYRAACRLWYEASSTTQTRPSSFIWRAKVQPKVALFAWHCAADALPTVVNLRRRGVRMDDGCCVCFYPNNVIHVLRRCSFGRLVFACSDLPWKSLDCSCVSVEDWFSKVFGELGS
ncbi:UNVERIFIED_CONTAM: putative mitochondrial protein [Sesamum radiatum]|uniref:Mitochondrial protein n=1 Tax=Sesamum radiatum TaxID=300843 RepID=A0AAW2LRI2_SESRA